MAIRIFVIKIRFTEIGCLLLSPFVGSFLIKFGRKNMVVAGFITLVNFRFLFIIIKVTGVASLALIGLIKNPYLYFWLSLVCRFI